MKNPTVALLGIPLALVGLAGAYVLGKNASAAERQSPAAAVQAPSIVGNGAEATPVAMAQAEEGLVQSTFPLSHLYYDLAVVSHSGLNTEAAEMTGKATSESIADYCKRNPGDIPGGEAGCRKRVLSDTAAKIFLIRANCKSGELVGPDHSTYRLQMPVSEDEQMWTDSSGEVVPGDYSTDNSIWFASLCPAVLKPWW